LRASRRPRAPQPDVGRARLEEATTFESIGPEWDELARRRKSIFATREWHSIWWEHFGRSGQLRLMVCRAASGEALGILPLYASRAGPLRVLRFTGHGMGDEGGPISAPESYPLMAASIRDLRRAATDWHVLLAEHLPGDFDWEAALAGRVLARASSPTIYMIADSWESYLASIGRRLRHEIRHDRRKLEREHRLQFRLVGDSGDASRLQSDLDAFFSLHAAKWPGSQFSRYRRFHEDFARRAHDRGWLRLWFLELDGQASAAWYGFRFEGVESHYQVGRDPTKIRESLGTVLTAHILRQAFGDGMEEYRFLRGDEAYKSRFANADPSLVTLAIARGPIAKASIAIGAFAGRHQGLASQVRRRLAPSA
jgi:CelD/BcsL family acetyltransferase involved in cellulose biosynthesis